MFNVIVMCVVMASSACSVSMSCTSTHKTSFPTCAEVECVSLSCGTLTPSGVKDPTVCTCGLSDGSYVTCVDE